MKRKISVLSLILVAIMLLSAVSCGKKATSSPSVSTNAPEASVDTTSPVEDTQINNTESEAEQSKEKESETQVETSDNADVSVSPIPLEGSYADIISLSNEYANGVNVYYSNSTRNSVVIENKNMSLSAVLNANGNQSVATLKNTQGLAYIENTMDVFVKMQNGDTYYASRSLNRSSINIDRFGYYYYQTTISGQNFTNEINVEKELNLNVGIPDRAINMSSPTIADGVVSSTVTSTVDPQFQYINIDPFSASDYNYLAITIKATPISDTQSITATLFIAAGASANFNNAQSTSVRMTADCEFHTYYVRLDNLPDYTNEVKKIRIDLDGNVGDEFSVKEIKAVKANSGGAPELAFRRTFNTFTDKNIQILQVSAKIDTNNIEKIGMITEIPSDKVEKIIVKDASGTHTSLESVDWSTAEYVGFDIKNVGIFGYILLNDATSGNITVELNNGAYIITQSRAPASNSLTVPTSTDKNANDFYMGQRIYTDENHDFAAFVIEAECERNPIPSENIIVNTTLSTDGVYVGYNALRGAYEFSLQDSGFNAAYFSEQNKHFNISFSIIGDNYDRIIYMMAAVKSGQLECAAVLDKKQNLLPIPVEVCKNFNDGDYSIHQVVDLTWSETFFPVPVNKSQETYLTLLHLYQNWGRFPLKQLSSIKFGCPYYHLSTGVTETNCILPWSSTSGYRSPNAMLPDHRAMSAPLWGNQPQHTSGGDHGFIEYVDASGKYNGAECIKNTITSYGPTYAEVVMDYISDDGKIKISYTHMEMPQTDENRGYYTISYEFLDEISFNSFKDDFTIYSVEPKSSVTYQNIGYLNENNECKVIPSNTKDKVKYYVLGDNCPYFSYFRDDDCAAADGYVNLSFLILNSDIKINGEETSPNFIISDLNKKIKLSLNLENVTFKAGDRIALNAIVMPWGSQVTDYDAEDRAPDQNVRDVRENSLLNPLVATAINNCKVLETAFLPQLRTTNGTSAEFTLSGGNNNCTVKIDGFTHLTTPTVYEFIDGAWTRYNLSSRYYPDKTDNTNRYDGYGVTYEDDGFFSYSFVVEMTDGESRIFKIVVDEEAYESEVRPPRDDSSVDESGIIEGTNHLFMPDNILTAVKNGRGSGNKEIISDGIDFVRIYGDSKSAEAFFSIYQSANDTSSTRTGEFFILKYRVPADKPENDYFAIFTSTEEAFAKAEHTVNYTKIKKDGEWHVLIINFADAKPDHFKANDSGTYWAQYLRFDVFNSKTAKTSYVDIALMAFDDDFSSALSLVAADHEYVDYYNGEHHVISTADGEMPEKKDPEDDVTSNNGLNAYLDPEALDLPSGSLSEIKVSEDKSYISYYSLENTPESSLFVFKNSTGRSTGQYLIFKYRTTVEYQNYFQFFTTTQSSLASNSSVTLTSSNGTYLNDGEWHVVVINLANAIPEHYTTRDDGKYYATAVRFDVFNVKMSSNDQVVDIAYIGLSDSFKSAMAFDSSVESIIYFNGKEAHTFSTENISNATEPEMPKEDDPQAPPSGGGNSEAHVTPEGFSIYYGASQLASMTSGHQMGERVLSSDGEYASYYSNESADESYFSVFNNRDKAIETGQYLVIKYKTSTPAAKNYFDFFITTEEKASGYVGSAHISFTATNKLYVDSDEWVVVVIDLSKAIPSYFSQDGDGAYRASYLRFDIYNYAMASSEYCVDVAYIGMSNDYDAIINYNKNSDNILFYDGSLQAVSTNE